MGRRRERRRKVFATITPAPEIRFSDLTSRQIEVLDLLADGKTNKEIAEALSLTPGTVKSHLYRLMRRSGLHTRTELAVRWAEIGRKMVGGGQGSGGEDQHSDTGRRIS
jgi:DNA-binding NarL/FixJ family response regulator